MIEPNLSPLAGPVVRDVPAVSRAAAILRLLARSDTPLGVHAVARGLGLVPSTCLHILRALVAEELAVFDPETKRYQLGGGVVALARGMLRTDVFSNLAQPMLDGLARRYGSTAVGVQVFGLDHIVAVAISRPERALQLQVDIGSRYPALISATGRCVAAFGGYPEAEIEARFGTLRWDDPPSLRTWRADVRATKELGYAVDEGRYITGVTVVSAPIVAKGRISHALTVIGVSERLRRVGQADVGQDLKTLAGELAERLG